MYLRNLFLKQKMNINRFFKFYKFYKIFENKFDKGKLNNL